MYIQLYSKYGVAKLFTVPCINYYWYGDKLIARLEGCNLVIPLFFQNRKKILVIELLIFNGHFFYF